MKIDCYSSLNHNWLSIIVDWQLIFNHCQIISIIDEWQLVVNPRWLMMINFESPSNNDNWLSIIVKWKLIVNHHRITINHQSSSDDNWFSYYWFLWRENKRFEFHWHDENCVLFLMQCSLQIIVGHKNLINYLIKCYYIYLKIYIKYSLMLWMLLFNTPLSWKFINWSWCSLWNNLTRLTNLVLCNDKTNFDILHILLCSI